MDTLDLRPDLALPHHVTMDKVFPTQDLSVFLSSGGSVRFDQRWGQSEKPP